MPSDVVSHHLNSLIPTHVKRPSIENKVLKWHSAGQLQMMIAYHLEQYDIVIAR